MENNDSSLLGPYQPILTDYGFKASFGNQQNTLFLRRALKALIKSDVEIKSVKFVKNEYIGASKQGRGARLDLICKDELGQVFIVEMQVDDTKNFIHRAKHYAFHVYNEMVKKGQYRFQSLKKIYMVSFLAKKTYSTKLYHQVASIKNQDCELVDEQITYVIVELDKFSKTLPEIHTDLDKLIYTMNQTANRNFQEVDFMREDWLSIALEALETANLTSKERMHLELDIAHRVAYEENIKEEAKEETKENLIVAALSDGELAEEKIAQIFQVPLARVLEIKSQL